WLKRDDDGGVTYGWGAWEVAARYSYLNLNDGPVRGGVMGGTTLGLNWYLNSNLKVQFEYLTNSRYDKLTGGNGNLPAPVQGFGSRIQFQFGSSTWSMGQGRCSPLAREGPSPRPLPRGTSTG